MTITLERLRYLVRYDQETGIFTRRVPLSGATRPGMRIGSPVKNYRRVMVDSHNYYEHRLAWFYVHGIWPECEIDHTNGKKSDNRICNLRLATRQQNNQSRGAGKNSKSGVKGISWTPKLRKWRAVIRANSKQYHLGYFADLTAAANAYAAAALIHHGQFAVLPLLPKEDAA